VRNIPDAPIETVSSRHYSERLKCSTEASELGKNSLT
jgi:hypothetical protein